jgi:hypothetical protein
VLNGMRALCVVVLGGYAALVFTDYRFASHANTMIPASVRASPGGYRAWSFWHSGEHGGK